MQDNSSNSDRIKRRRLNGDEEEELTAAARERMFQQAAASAEGSNNSDLTALLLRQRLLAAEQQKNEVALQAQLARYSGNNDGFFAGGASASDLLAAAGGGSGANSTDPMVSHLRQNLINQQLQSANARFDPLQSYLRGSEASPSAFYASLLGSTSASRGVPGGLTPAATRNALLYQQLQSQQQQQQEDADGRRTTDPRASYMQSLLAAEESEAAAMATDPAIMRARLLGLDPSSSVLARLQNERAALLGQAGASANRLGHPSAFPQSALDPFLQRGPGAGAAGMYSHHEMLLAARGTAGAASFLGGPGGMQNSAAAANTTATQAAAAAPTNPNQTGRQPIHLYMSCDDDDLSPYQCLVRKQIELFEAQDVDAETNARGRNRPIVVGQVGIRCKWCKTLPPRKRERAAIYYPSKLDRLYQAGQTMASVHLGQHCNHIPTHIRTELARLREGKSAALAGKKYWSDGARALGVTEEDERLFFRQQES